MKLNFCVMAASNQTCKNCESQFDSSFKFCPYCGQKANDKLTIGVLFYNTISNYFSFDARFFKSFVPLMLKPGFIAKEFVGGKRLQYLHPAQYYLFVSVVFFFILSFKVNEYNRDADLLLKKGFELEQKINVKDKPILDSLDIERLKDSILNNEAIEINVNDEERRQIDSTLKANISNSSKNSVDFGFDTKKLDSLINAGASEKDQLSAMGLNKDSGFIKETVFKQLLKFYKQRGGGIVSVFFDTIPIALFLLLPIFALILKLFFWRRGSYSHHLVFSFYYFSFLFVVLSLLIGINYFINIPGWVELFIVWSTFFYLWLSMKRFYEQGYFVTLIKTGVISFSYSFIIVIATALLILATLFIFY
jgi:hypothetical protein